MPRVSDYDYQFPVDLIATRPASPRSHSKLMIYSPQKNSFSHRHFYQLAEELDSSYVMVLNQTKVMPARFFAQKESGKKLEGLFFRFDRQGRALVWLQGRLSVGSKILFDDLLSATVVNREGRDVYLEVSKDSLQGWLQKNALPALPPYIRKRREDLGESENSDRDWHDYQSLWAKKAYSIAAPTASLHFDEELFHNIQKAGVRIEYISLHIGAGTFLPLEKEDASENKLHYEQVEISPEVWSRIKEAKKHGKKILAVGTTVTRALESAARREAEGLSTDLFETDLFIYPPFEFKIVDSLITNFHQPRSSLLMLVDAFVKARWRDLYTEAIRERYRLFSYGDALWIRE